MKDRLKEKNIIQEMDKKKLYRIITAFLFIVLIIRIIVSTTYLFRNTNSDRLRIIGLKEEENLDMVYIGGSAAFVYWQPLKAWNDYGFTSYNYAVNTVQAEGIKYLMKEAMKTHNPELFVVDLRAFQYWEPEMLERGARTIADQVDYSWNRFEFLNYYFSSREKDKDIDYLSYYFEIVKYHTNQKALMDAENWERIANKGTTKYKGWETSNSIHSFQKPENFMVDERAELQSGLLNILEELLDFCEENEIEVLFTVCPYVTEMEHQKIYNALKDIIEARGFHYINTNEYYDEMKIDFATDFYDRNHVNCFGAEKYTQYLGEYIIENFQLSDHRDEIKYQNWNEEYIQFVNLTDGSKKELNDIIKEAEQAEYCSGKMRETEDLYEWQLLTRKEGFTMFITGEITDTSETVEESALLEHWGIELMNGKTTSYVAVMEQGELLYSNQGENLSEYQGMIAEDTSKEKTYTINSENKSILINNEEYSLKQKGLNLVVYNNYSEKVVDSVIIRFVNGRLVLER